MTIPRFFQNAKVQIWILLLFSFHTIQSQVLNSKGVPFIQHFENSQHKNYSQIWDITEAPNHIMYFVNEKGLLEYDGYMFNNYKGSKGITRSLKIKSNDTIYTGSDDDFGIWTKNQYNSFTYQSLYEKLKKKSSVIEEFWNIYFLNETIVFQSFNNLYCIENDLITKINAPSRFITGFQAKNKIYLVDENYGFYVYDSDGLHKIDLHWHDDFSQIVAIDEFLNQMYVITKNKGIYVFENQKLTRIIPYNFEKYNNEVFSYTSIQQKYFVLGTILNGVVIIDQNGNTLHRLNKLKGLQNNTILSVFCSQYGKLWLGLDFGIDALHLSSPYSFILDYEGKIGTTYTALLKENTLYLGTNQGLYSTSFQNLENSNSTFNYQTINNSQGQVWHLTEIDGKIYCGHNRGLFELKNQQIFLIDNKPGVWWMVKMYDAILTGNYNGIHIYKEINNQLQYFKTLSEVKGSCNQLCVFQNKLIVLLGNIGVLELTLNSNFEIINRKFYDKKLFNNENIYITIKGNSLIVNSLYNQYTKNLTENTDFKVQPLAISKDVKQIINQNWFFPSEISSQYNVYSVYNGFVLRNRLDKRSTQFEKTPAPIIRSVEAFNNNQRMKMASKEKLQFNFNNVHINYIVPNTTSDVAYRYQLKGFSDNQWSVWNSKPYTEFINLKEGNYEFIIQAKSSQGISQNTSYKFQVNPPFYRSIWAYILYIILLAIFINRMNNLHKTRLKKQKLALLKEQKEKLNEQSIKYQERIMIEKNEKLELEKQQLRKTVENKELELAKKIIDQKEINDLIQSIKKKVEETQIKSAQKLSNKNYNDLLNYLDKKVNKELNKEYEIAFDSSQTIFHENLLKKHPNLSAKDLRISSYITMNLSSKEIAKILQVLPTSIDVNRSRLRKKLQLDDEKHLRDYLIQFHTQ